MSFTPWEPIPPETALCDLFTTSILIWTRHPRPGVLLRCSAGLEDGSATIVHASTQRPNALRMLGADDNMSIGDQAKRVLKDSRVQMIAIPHISWKQLGSGLRWRTPVAILLALATGLIISLLPFSLGYSVTLPIAVASGAMLWLLLRRRSPTRIGPAGGPHMSIDDVLQRVQPHSDKSPAPHPRGTRAKDNLPAPSRIQ